MKPEEFAYGKGGWVEPMDDVKKLSQEKDKLENMGQRMFDL